MAESISPPDVGSLLQQYKLTEDVCSQQVSAVHLEEISRSHCKDWRKLPAHLDLPEIVASDIDRKQVEENEKRKNFFTNWQETKGSAATYKSLISALLKIDCRQDAEGVCKLVKTLLSNQTLCDQTTPRSSVNTDQATSATENRFPYLNASDLTKEEKDRLVTQLEGESEKIQYKFAELVAKTQESLKEHGISSKDLASLLKNSIKRHLTKLCDSNPEIPDFILQLSDHWSFFDYDLLGSIIECFCSDLKSEFEEYVKKFKIFCRRRICELPDDIFKTKKHKNNLYVKYDENFDKITLEQVKKLQYKLSKLLETELHLLEIKKGCIELIFESVENIEDILFPLDKNKKALLSQMKVTYIRNNDDLQLYPEIQSQDDDSTSIDSGFGTGSLASDFTDFDRLSLTSDLEVDKNHDSYQDPSEVTKVGSLRCPAPSYCWQNFPSESYGKWMLFRNFEDLNDTWCAVREAVMSGELGATGAICGTLKYNPLQHGAGPATTQRIAVYTKEDDYIDVGMKLVKLKAVQHDIKYKTMKDAKFNKGALAHVQSERPHRVTSMTIFWNDGAPSKFLKPGTKQKHAPCRCDWKNYKPAEDRWKINIVNGDISQHLHGKWILESNYDPKSNINVYIVWHTLKAMIEDGKLPAIKMECPAPEYRRAKPKIHIFTSHEHMDNVGKMIASKVQQNLLYVVGGGNFRGDKKVLYWNNSEPSYEDISQAKTGIMGDWRSQN